MRRARQRPKTILKKLNRPHTPADLLKGSSRRPLSITAEMRAWLDAPPVGLELAADAVEKMKVLMRQSPRLRRHSIKRLINEGRA